MELLVIIAMLYISSNNFSCQTITLYLRKITPNDNYNSL